MASFELCVIHVHVLDKNHCVLNKKVSTTQNGRHDGRDKKIQDEDLPSCWKQHGE